MELEQEFLQSLNESLLNESGLARIYQKTKDHEYGTITAFRGAEDCGEGKAYSKADNMKRNKSLLSKLKAKKYSITSIKGSYIENYGSNNEKEVSENSFIVVDQNDSGDLRKVLLQLGEEFEQDSIIWGNAGGAGILIGTNKCPDGYPGYHKEAKQGGALFGEKGEFMSRVKGRPFVFKESLELHEERLPKYPTEIKSIVLTSRLHWSDLEL